MRLIPLASGVIHALKRLEHEQACETIPEMTWRPDARDVDHVIHVILSVMLLAATATVALFIVPTLFNQHSSVDDLVVIVVSVGTIATDYLAGRYIWHSWKSVSEGNKE